MNNLFSGSSRQVPTPCDHLWVRGSYTDGLCVDFRIDLEKEFICGLRANYMALVSEAEAESQTKVAYVMSRFPKLTETFILNEMIAVERRNVQIEVFPILRARNKRIYQEGASVFKKVVELLLPERAAPLMHEEAAPYVERAHYGPLLSWSILKAQARALLREPTAYLDTLWTLIKANWGSANLLIGSLAIFPKAVYWAQVIATSGIEHVHAHFANHPATAAFVIHRLSGVPYSFTAHGADLQVDQHMLREKVEEAAFVVTISRHNCDLILSKCGPDFASKVHLLYCGVDPQFFVPPAPNGRLAGDCLEILCIGTFYEVKGQAYLIEACRLLKSWAVPFRCRLVGEGPDLSALKALVREYGLEEQVQFPGTYRRQEVAALLRQVDVLVVPSVPTREGRREGIPVVLMEAMASGLPVVASNISGIPELVEHGVSGLLVAPRDGLALARCLEQLATDSELRSRMGTGGREKILADFDLQKNADRLVRYFRQNGDNP